MTRLRELQQKALRGKGSGITGRQNTIPGRVMLVFSWW